MTTTPELLQRSIDEHKRTLTSPGPVFVFGTRVKYTSTLFIDDIYLESLVNMNMPVVKLLSTQWGNLSLEEKKYTIHPDWHDG